MPYKPFGVGEVKGGLRRGNGLNVASGMGDGAGGSRGLAEGFGDGRIHGAPGNGPGGRNRESERERA